MKDRFLKIIKEEGIFLLLILIGVILFWMPYMAQGFTKGSEVEFHYARIMTLSDSLQTGIFPAKVRPSHMRGFGYGIGFFYPDLLIYPPAALIALGAGYDITIKVYLFVVSLVLCIVTYRCFKQITGNRWIALMGQILVMNCAINDQNIFDGGGMPHLFAYLFLPLALCGLLRALKDEKSGYIQYAVGLMMVLLTHNMIFLTMMFVMIFVVLLHLGNIIRKPAIILRLMAVSATAMIMTTAYWLPAMEQVSHIDFIVFFDNAYSVTDHILTLGKLLLQDVGVLYSCLFGAAMVVYVIMLIRKRKMPLDIHTMLILNILVIFFSCSRAVWLSGIGEILSFFEYTDRFEFVLAIMMIMFILMTVREAIEEFAAGAKTLFEGRDRALLVVCLILLVVTRFAARPGFYNPSGEKRIQLYYDMLTENWQVSGAEWLPVECEPTECKEAENARASDGSSADGFKHEKDKYFEVWVDLSKEYYDMPYVYYYGYHAYLLDDEEKPVRELEVSEAFDDNGYVRVTLPEDLEGMGHILTTYRKTDIQKISYVISILSVVLFFALHKRYCMLLFNGCQNERRQ
jgi:hypothetical protein